MITVQKGFEKFLRAGLIEISKLEKDNEVYTIQKVWQGMAATGKVPFLPDTIDYASYLDSLLAVHRNYKLSSISDRFRNNLLAGVDSGAFVLSVTDGTDQHLLQMFRHNSVNFRDIYDFIYKQRNAEVITQERYEEIYYYSFGCYNVNISAETGCYVSSKPESVPLHLDSSAGNFDEGLASADQGGLYSTWAMEPELLDLISTDEFIDVRNEARKTVQEGELVNYYTGVTKREDWKDFRGKWELYMRTLEKGWTECLTHEERSICEWLADNGEVKQRKIFFDGAAMVSSVSPIALKPPGIGRFFEGVSGYAGAVMSVDTLVSDLKRRREEVPLRERRKQIKQFLAFHPNNTGIITRYGTNTN